MAKIDPTEFLVDLPQEKRRALCEIGKRIRKFYRSVFGLTERDYATLAQIIHVFARRNSIVFTLSDHGTEIWQVHLDTILDELEGFEVDLHAEEVAVDLGELVDEYREASAAEVPFGYAVLSSDEKSEIHQRLTQIRSIVEGSKLHDKKKNALYSRIGKLSGEVDRNGTRTDAFFAFGLDLAMTAGEMAEKAKPAINEFKDVLKIILRRRAESEGVQLPKPEDFPSLSKPGGES